MTEHPRLCKESLADFHERIRNIPPPKLPKTWVNTITKDCINENQSPIHLETKVIDNKKRLLVRNSIIDFETRRRKNTLVGIFMGIHPNLEAICLWMFEKWKTSRQVDLIALLGEFLMLKFTKAEDMEKVLELGPWFMGRKGVILQKWGILKSQSFGSSLEKT